MTSNTIRRIAPLTRQLLPRIPWFIKCLGGLNDRWNVSVVEAVLATRDDTAVKEAWRKEIPNAHLVENILTTIGTEMCWKNPRFIPEDECFVVMKLWWHGIADALERERCLWALEEHLGKKVPPTVLPMLIDMNLGEFLEQFQEEPAS